MKRMEQDKSDIVEKDAEVVVEESPPTETTVTKQTLHIAPIPDAESFREYESVLKGAGHRIITMAEKAQQKDIDNSKRRLELEALRLKCTTFISMLIFLASIMAIHYDAPIVAGVGMGISMGGMIFRIFFMAKSGNNN